MPILLATRSTVDVGSDPLVRAGIADVVRRPIANAELAAALSRSLRSAAGERSLVPLTIVLASVVNLWLLVAEVRQDAGAWRAAPVTFIRDRRAASLPIGRDAPAPR
jgi:DNA-binding response OmpR family regulator